MKIGIFIPNWIGDTVMCTPALRALRQHHPAARLVGIIRPYVADVLTGTPWLDEQILYHPRSKDPAHKSLPVLKQLRRERYDALVLFTNSFRAAAVAWLSGAPIRVGNVRYGRGPLLTHKVYEPKRGFKRLPTSAIDTYLNLTYTLGCQPQSPRMELATTAADEAAADAFWQKARLPIGQQVVVLNSSGAYGAAKLWPMEYFAQLARRIVDEQGLAVLMICGPSERKRAREFVAAVDHPRVVSLADEAVSIGLTKACVRRSRLMVSTDSGPRFFAVAFGVPVVSIFGPTDIAWSDTHDAGEVYLSESVPCGPCGKRVCPLQHHDCMRKLSVERVYAAVLEQLKARRVTQAA